MKVEFIPILGIIWGAFAILTGMTIFFADANIWVIIVLAIAATASTLGIVDPGSGKSSGESSEKAKRSGRSDTDMLLNLLDPEDLEDLRMRVKQRLMDNIEGSGDGELSSIEALLAEQKDKRRS